MKIADFIACGALGFVALLVLIMCWATVVTWQLDKETCELEGRNWRLPGICEPAR